MQHARCVLLSTLLICVHAYDLVGSGWCRDDEARLMPYWLSYRITTATECENVCTALDTDCAGYGYLQPECAVMLAQTGRSVPNGWSEQAGTGATTITTSTGESGPLCYKRGAVLPDNSTEETNTPSEIPTEAPVVVVVAEETTSDSAAVWSDPVVAMFVSISLVVASMALLWGCWVDRTSLPLLFAGSSVQVRSVGVQDVPKVVPKVHPNPLITDDFAAFCQAVQLSAGDTASVSRLDYN